MTITSQDLPGILERHRKWLRSEDGGSRANLFRDDLSGANLSGADLSRADLSRANLSGADLSRANLSGADLSGANLFRADLSGADLSGANLFRANLFRADLSGADLSGANLSGAVHGWAKIAFAGHGECGRMLTAIRLKEGDEPRLFCGCFDGTSTELVEYIQKGKAEYRATRTKAMQCVLELLDMKNGEA